MPNATVRANARPIPKPAPKRAAVSSAPARGKRRLTAAELAATSFEPLSAAELKRLQPPSEDVWKAKLVGYRVALSVLKKSKDELKGVVQKDAADDVLMEITELEEYLVSMVDVLSTAKTRLLIAATAEKTSVHLSGRRGDSAAVFV